MFIHLNIALILRYTYRASSTKSEMVKIRWFVFYLWSLFQGKVIQGIQGIQGKAVADMLSKTYLSVILNSSPNFIHVFYEKSIIRMKSLDIKNKLREINEYVRLTLEKLPAMREDLARLNDFIKVDWEKRKRQTECMCLLWKTRSWS